MTSDSESSQKTIVDEKAMPRMAMKDGQGRALVNIPDVDRLKCGSMIDFESMTAAGQNVCVIDLVKQALLLVQMESCGQCVFCREGTIQMIKILTDIREGSAEAQDLELLLELGKTMRLGASCSLGRMAPEAVLSSVEHFRQEYEAHIKEKRCSAGICNLIV